MIIFNINPILLNIDIESFIYTLQLMYKLHVWSPVSAQNTLNYW